MILDFGDPEFEFDSEFPNKTEFKRLPRRKMIKLMSVRYKHRYNDSALAGIQLEFDSYKTPLFETEWTREEGWDLQSIQVPGVRSIRYVEMKVAYGSSIRGLILRDENKQVIVEKTWYKRNNEGEWVR